MSASAPAPPPPTAARTEWRGEGVELDDVVERLLRMNHEHAREARGHAATRTLNLLVAPGADVGATALAERLEGLRTRHPSRTIVLREHRAARLDALLAIDCTLDCAPGAAGYCHDTVELSADAARLHHAGSLVHALLVSGLPVVLWLPGAQESAAEDALAHVAEAIVLDSGAAPELRMALARAARLGAAAPGDAVSEPPAARRGSAARAGALAELPAARVRDLAWQRLTRWRQRIAARFDAPAARALLDASERLELRCGGPDMAAPLLLAGWIAARAGWALERLDGADGQWEGTARRPGGAEVALALGSPAPQEEPEGIHVLTFAAKHDTLELREPVAEPDAERAFAAALRSYDEPASGYAPALAALCDGLGIR